MPLTPGTAVGRYQVVGPLGAGGMGEVYRARDASLDRDVALKILPEHWANDADRLARFDREARVLASMNHPNIAAIYGRERAGDLEALVLELVEGQTLEDMLRAGPLPLDEALQFARQVALALEAAHAQGILHRDLKPANLKIRPDGAVKVLDFGLAKAMGPAGADDASARAASAATVTSPMTELGMVLGTAAYMAPEQAKGRRVDARADVWAFGCVLFEMLAGRRAFEGDDVTETLAAIVRGEPDWAALPAGVPPRVRRLLRRCLRKDWAQRLHDIGDARLELEDAGDDDPVTAAGAAQATSGSGRTAGRRELLGWGVAALAIGVAVWLAFAAGDRATGATPPISFELGEVETSALFTQPLDFVLSPDGQHVAFSARQSAGTGTAIWIRSLGSPVPRMLAGSEGGSAPFWSPDSRTVGFATREQLRKMSLDGGLPQKITDVPATVAGAAWSPAGTIVYSSGTQLFRVPASGGTPERLCTDEDVAAHGAHRWPAFLPDGRHFITVRSISEDAVMWSLDSPAPPATALFDTSSKVIAAREGYLLFVRDGVLLAQPFDLTERTLTGEAVPVAENIFTISFTGNLRGGAADFSVSETGVLLHRSGGDPDSQLLWFDRRGRRLDAVPGPAAGYSGISISPDETQITFHIHTSKGGDIYVMDLARGAQSQITFGDGHASSPFWIGSDRVGFAVLKPGTTELFFTRVSGTDRQQTHIAEVGGSVASSDGTQVVWNRDGSLWLSRLGGADPPVPLGQGSYPDLSPDGRWLAYQSNLAGRVEIYVRALAGGAEPIRVSTDGGTKPRWGTGGELFFLSRDARLMSASLRLTSTPPVAGAPAELFRPDFRCATCAFVPYDVAAGNQKVLILANVQDDRRIEPATLVFDWTSRIRR